ncbi:MAG: ribonuclease III [Actinomycetota bacterium]|nr:ribonuclease III [Actinomycetota bacterium]
MAITQADRPSRLNRKSGLEVLGIPPGGGPLYELALTHRSHAFEHPVPGPAPAIHNERLEFLGDSILGAVVTTLLYQDYPELPEGDMARLRASVVNTLALAEMARDLGIGDHLRLGRGEEATGGRGKPSLLANTFEAIVGALYLDRGMEHVTSVLRPMFAVRLSDGVAGGERYDAKNALQEVAVRDFGRVPTYRVTASGPDHSKSFAAEVVVVGESLVGAGRGRSKKEAEQKAARAALKRLTATVESASGADSGPAPGASHGRGGGPDAFAS